MSCARLVNIPGPGGDDGNDGDDGAAGANAYGALLSEFTMPIVGGLGLAEIDDSGFIVPSNDIGTVNEVDGTIIIVQYLGYFLCSDIIDATHVLLYNLGYPNSAPPGTIAPTGSKVGIGGREGP